MRFPRLAFSAFILLILTGVTIITTLMYLAFGMVGTWIMFGIVSIFYFWASIGALKSRKRLEEAIDNMGAPFHGKVLE